MAHLSVYLSACLLEGCGVSVSCVATERIMAAHEPLFQKDMALLAWWREAKLGPLRSFFSRPLSFLKGSNGHPGLTMPACPTKPERLALRTKWAREAITWNEGDPRLKRRRQYDAKAFQLLPDILPSQRASCPLDGFLHHLHPTIITSSATIAATTIITITTNTITNTTITDTITNTNTIATTITTTTIMTTTITITASSPPLPPPPSPPPPPPPPSRHHHHHPHPPHSITTTTTTISITASPPPHPTSPPSLHHHHHHHHHHHCITTTTTIITTITASPPPPPP
ncbi:Mitogen-Activated Protein Kinase Kinase Kinase 6 [Manis pentadactyla]|nr:Mitogen-Activated Protein Kinase Kinase Kinase 6 [Manis pentadactyla]